MSSHPCKPHCFCQQSATLVPTADFGLVYECHYTDTTVWNYYPVDCQKLAGTFWSNVAPPTSNWERPQTGQEGSGLTSPSPTTAGVTASVPPLSSSNKTTTNTNDQPRATTPPWICGFHFHARDWATFAERFFQASLKSVQKRVASNVYYSQHYREVAKNFPEEHYAVVLMARTASCSAQLASVAHWLGWEAALDFPKLFGVAPNCFCNRPMTVCSLRPSMNPPTYFCHQRQKTNIGGCSRFLGQKTRSLRQPRQPCHPLDVGEPQSPIKQQKRAAAHHSNRPPSGSPEAQSQSTIKMWNYATTSVVTKKLFDRDGEDFEEEEIPISGETRKQSQPMDPSSEGMSGQGTTEQGSEPDVSGLDDLQQKLILGLETLAQQSQRRAELSVIRKEALEEHHKSKSALEIWKGSVERLKAQIEIQHQLGYNNPDLTCVACREGPIDYAMIPCFHMAMCSACICELKVCVLCKAAIKSVQRVYW